MDNLSVTMNVEEELASLQIVDFDLAASTSLTSATPTHSTPSITPKNNRTENGGGSIIVSKNNEDENEDDPTSEWTDFYERLGRTPPKATRTDL